jgi:hypothetical protein
MEQIEGSRETYLGGEFFLAGALMKARFSRFHSAVN